MTQLINNGEQPPQNQYSPIEESMQASNAKATCRRGAAYTIKEYELLCIAWLEQRGSAYLKRIHEYFHERKNYPPHCFTNDRNESSLAHRWSTIQDATNKFCGVFEQVNNRKMGMAMSLYNSNEGKPFGFVHCWTKLNKAPKWEAIVSSLKEGHGSSKKQKSNEGSSCQSSSLNEDGEAGEGLASGGRVQRPKGRKACMWQRVEEKKAKKEERHQAFMEIQRQKVALEQKVDTDAENVATARLSEDSKIMFADTSLMDENQRQWVDLMRGDILARRVKTS
ncbi:hypothetical protein BRADI_3g52517v3 [Brachypodium distachyon]|uniref:No apical meristem-associated C-terminal domain-containing protein n=1 Tax=Brachypodium distachyon TaxID=15368 RepID=A0A2K2D4R9_BRADI|nr:hypothetical protein BRADI_3g52517v3 [Brachypodium distachyon]